MKTIAALVIFVPTFLYAMLCYETARMMEGSRALSAAVDRQQRAWENMKQVLPKHGDMTLVQWQGKYRLVMVCKVEKNNVTEAGWGDVVIPVSTENRIPVAPREALDKKVFDVIGREYDTFNEAADAGRKHIDTPKAEAIAKRRLDDYLRGQHDPK